MKRKLFAWLLALSLMIPFIPATSLVALATGTYTVTVDPAVVNGTVAVDKDSGDADETVTVTATPADGYMLGRITVNGAPITGNTFAIEGDTVVGASFRPIPHASEHTQYTGFTSVTGTSGANGNEGPAKLVDNNSATKWCVTNYRNGNVIYVEFQSPTAFAPLAYVLTTGNDTHTGANDSGYRNPTGWVLKGKAASGDAWTVLASETDNRTLPDANYADTEFAVQNPAVCSYFRFEVNSIVNSNVFQLSELKLYGEDSLVLPIAVTARGLILPL